MYCSCSQKVIWMGFFVCFFRIYVNLWKHCNTFPCFSLFFLHIITGRNEAIMWNRHAVADNFFYMGVIFFNFCRKMKLDYVHCPMRKFWRPSLRPFVHWTLYESLRIEIPGEGCTSLPRVKPWWSFVCPFVTLPHGAHRGKNGSFLAIGLKMYQKNIFP